MRRTSLLQGVRTLVLDAEAKSAYAVVRSLGRNGAVVLAANSAGSDAPARRSRYVARRLTHPSALLDPEPLLVWLADVIAAERPLVVLPQTEYTIRVLDGARDRFSDGTVLVLPPRDAIDVCFDKGRLLGLAESLGIAIPRTWRPSTLEEALGLAEGLPYPVYIKARRSYDWHVGGAPPRFARGRFVPDVEAFRPAYEHLHRLSALPLVQEAVRGTNCTVAGVWKDGSGLGSFLAVEERAWPISGGFGSFRRSLPPTPDLEGPTNALLSALGWSGVAEAEFVVDDADGRPKLMEVNGRMWGSVDFAQYCGVDITLATVQTALGHAVTHPDGYRAGKRSRWLEGDLKRVFVAFARRRQAQAETLHMPTRLETVVDLLWGGRLTVHQDDFYADDLAPFVALIGRTLATAAKGEDAGSPSAC